MDLLNEKKTDLSLKKSTTENNVLLKPNIPVISLPPISKRSPYISSTEKEKNNNSKIYSKYNTNTIMKIPSKKLYKRTIDTNINLRQASGNYMIRTSLSHPLNVSWITPIENMMIDTNDIEKIYLKIGKLALSSCPGKKVRLNTGPVNGRAVICRDLDIDLKRLSGYGIKTIVCCLNNAELSYLGSPWKTYSEKAKENDIEILRFPIIEGSCPDSIVDVDELMNEMCKQVKEGKNILCHCRGGIGRAGLIACCYLLKLGYTQNSYDAIKIVRAQRSPQAIETRRQEDFIVEYAKWLKKQNQIQNHNHNQNEIII